RRQHRQRELYDEEKRAGRIQVSHHNARPRRDLSGVCGGERSWHRCERRPGDDELCRAMRTASPQLAFGGGLPGGDEEGAARPPLSFLRRAWMIRWNMILIDFERRTKV